MPCLQNTRSPSTFKAAGFDCQYENCASFNRTPSNPVMSVNQQRVVNFCPRRKCVVNFPITTSEVASSLPRDIYIPQLLGYGVPTTGHFYSPLSDLQICGTPRNGGSRLKCRISKCQISIQSTIVPVISLLVQWLTESRFPY